MNGGKAQRPDIETVDAIGACNSKCGLIEVACGRPERNHESDFSCDASGSELDCLSAGAVEPLEVVDRNQCRSSVGEPLQNGEEGCGDDATVHRGVWSSRAQANHIQRFVLEGGQCTKHRLVQVGQLVGDRRVRQLGLRLRRPRD